MSTKQQGGMTTIMRWTLEWGASVVAVIGFVAAIATIGTWLFGDSVWPTGPDVRFQKSGPFPMHGESFYGITLSNIGNEQAQNLEFSIAFAEAEIGDYGYNDQDFITKPFNEHSSDKKKIVFKVARLSPQNEKVIIALPIQGTTRVDEPNITCIHDGGVCTDGIYPRSHGDTVLIMSGALLLVVFLIQNISRLYRFT